MKEVAHKLITIITEVACFKLHENCQLKLLRVMDKDEKQTGAAVPLRV